MKIECEKYKKYGGFGIYDGLDCCQGLRLYIFCSFLYSIMGQ